MRTLCVGLYPLLIKGADLMPTKQLIGNILDTNCDLLVHQVNGLGVMGAGLAKQIAGRYPHVERDYKRFVLGGDRNAQDLLGECLILKASDTLRIANVFGQAGVGRDKRQTDYDALKRGLDAVANVARKEKLSVAIPYKLGCGLAGGNWDIVETMIDLAFANVDVSIYHYEPGASR